MKYYYNIVLTRNDFRARLSSGDCDGSQQLLKWGKKPGHKSVIRH